MERKFDEKKATQLAAYFLRSSNGSMDKLKLIKLIYIADRAALMKYGFPITYDQYFSLPHGPIASSTLDLINDREFFQTEEYWTRYILPLDRNIVRVSDVEAPIDELSPAELQIAESIFRSFGGMNAMELRDYSHVNFPEYQYPGNSRIPIRLEDILETGGWTREQIDSLHAEFDVQSWLKGLNI